jgi:hypothetical protein
LSNILAIVLIAHYSRGNLDEFRIGSLVFALHAFVVGIIRIVCVEPILLKWTNASFLGQRALRLGFIGIPVVIAVLAASRGLPTTSGLAYAVALPALAGQEALRGAFFASGRPARAATMDMVWLAFMLLCFLGIEVISSRGITPGGVVLVWALTGSASFSLGYAMWRRGRVAVDPLMAVTERRRDLISLAASAGIAGAAVPLASVALNITNRGIIAADWRTAASIFAPVNIMASTMHLYIVPHAVKSSGRDLVKWIRRYQGSLLALSVAWCALLQILVWVGLVSKILGDPWKRIEPYVLLLFASQVLLGLAGGQFIGLRLRGRPTGELRARGFYAVGTSVLVPVGAYLFNLKGAFLGASLAAALAAMYATVDGSHDHTLRVRRGVA